MAADAAGAAGSQQTPAEQARVGRARYAVEQLARAREGRIELRRQDVWIELWDPVRERATYYNTATNYTTGSQEKTPFVGRPNPASVAAALAACADPAPAADFEPQGPPQSHLCSAFATTAVAGGAGVSVAMPQRTYVGTENLSEATVRSDAARIAEETRRDQRLQEEEERRKRAREVEAQSPTVLGAQRAREDQQARKRQRLAAMEGKLLSKWGIK
eukprot:TRINITY_DN23495_c0_g1_i1.p1 TRINITY_DN23495_c0_g1~~TRINITY_DN23495_c0_g1_i1.p1  ORF type:complete len:241 (+),score=84.68 TRINITY_DN23495_c0_g1_i1:74-724(+)